MQKKKLFGFLYFGANLQIQKCFNFDCCEDQCGQKLPKSCPKMISLEKLKIMTTLQKLPKNVGDLG